MKKYLIFSFVFLATLAFGAPFASAQNAPYITISANPQSVQYNGNTTISYTVTGATSCQGSMGSLGWSGAKSTYGGSFYTTPLTATTTYVLTCTNNYGSMTKSVTVNVNGSGGGSGGGCNNSCGGGNNYPPSVNISANPTLVSYNGSSTISWSSTGASSCYASGGTAGWSGSKSTSGSFYANSLTSTTTFSIACTNSYGTTNQSTTVSVQPYNPPQNPLPSVTISADQIYLPYNGTTYIRWNVTNATACQAYGGANGWAGSKNINGGSFFTGQMTQNTNYKIICFNSSGQDEASVTVSVDAKPVQNLTVDISADQTYLSYGQSTYIRWNTTNATSCNATGGTNNWAGTKSAYGGTFHTGQLTSTKTFTLTCTNSNGSVSDSVTVNVENQAQDPSIQTNSATNINSNSATLNGYLDLNGNPEGYSAFAWGLGSNLTNITAFNIYTSNTNLSYQLNGLQENTTYSFQAITENDNGDIIRGEIRTFRTTGGSGCNYNCGGNNYDRPNVTTYVATDVRQNEAMINGYVESNGSYTTRWFEWGTNYSSLYNSTNRYSQSGNYGNFGERISGLQANTTYYFRAVAQNSNGISYGNVLSFTTTSQNYYNNCFNYGNCAPQAVTTIATNVGGNGARLNGLGAQDTNVQMTGYFEYGLTQSLGRTTASAFIGSGTSNPFNTTVYDLVPGTTYYYRAVVTTQYGVSRGDIQSFRTNLVINNTSRTTVINRTVVTNTSTNTNEGVGLSKPSLVFLTIDRGGEIINIGQEITYNIYYKNVSTKDLRDVVLRVALPKELDFVSSSRGYWSEENNTVVVNIGSLFPQEEGSVRVTALVTRNAEIGKIVVVTANIAYTINQDGSQEEVFAYSKNNVENNGLELRGNVFFGAGFWPDTLAGWLILLLLILLIILVLRLIYGRLFPARTVTTNTNTGHTTTTFHH